MDHDGHSCRLKCDIFSFSPKVPLSCVRVANIKGLCTAGLPSDMLQLAIADFARERAMSFAPSLIEGRTSLTAYWTLTQDDVNPAP